MDEADFEPVVGNCDRFDVKLRNEMSRSIRTTDHAKIREWAEARNGRPARVQGTGDADHAGSLRIDFPARESAGNDELEELGWDQFFEIFDEQRLAFVYQEQTAAGRQSRFNKFVGR